MGGRGRSARRSLLVAHHHRRRPHVVCQSRVSLAVTHVRAPIPILLRPALDELGLPIPKPAVARSPGSPGVFRSPEVMVGNSVDENWPGFGPRSNSRWTCVGSTFDGDHRGGDGAMGSEERRSGQQSVGRNLTGDLTLLCTRASKSESASSSLSPNMYENFQGPTSVQAELHFCHNDPHEGADSADRLAQ